MSISNHMEDIYDKISSGIIMDENSNFYKIVEETVANPSDNVSEIAETVSSVIFPEQLPVDCVYNQLYYKTTDRVTIKGVTITTVENNKIHMVGTKTTAGEIGAILRDASSNALYTVANHKYYCYSSLSEEEYQNFRWQFYKSGSSTIYINKSDGILDADVSGRAMYIDAYFLGTNQSIDITFDVNVIDLTLMFGSGSEPNLDTCNKLFKGKKLQCSPYGDMTPWALVPHDLWLDVWGRTLGITNQYCLDVGRANGVTASGIGYLIWSNFENASGCERDDDSSLGRHQCKLIQKNSTPKYPSELYYVQVSDSAETTINSTGAIFNNGSRGLNHKWQLDIGILVQHGSAVAPSIIVAKYNSIVSGIIANMQIPNSDCTLNILLYDDSTYQQITV